MMRTETALGRRDHGFTLVELLTVAIVVSILSAVGVPVYLKHRNNAAEDSVRQDAESAGLALTAQVTGSGSLPSPNAAGGLDATSVWGFKPTTPDNRLVEYMVAEDRFRICVLNTAANPDAWAIYTSASGNVTSGTGTEPTGACDGNNTAPALGAEPTRGASTPIPTPSPTAIPTITPPPPGAPAGVSATTVLGESQARVAWGAVSGATGYKVYVDGSTTAAWTGTSLSTNIGGLSNGSHTFRVSATNTNGEGALSAQASATVDSNDNVAAADTISATIAAGATWTSADYSNATATTQSGETTPNARTLWWRLTPTAAATYTFDVIAPSSGTIPATAPTLTVWQVASGSTAVPATTPTIVTRGAYNPAGSQTSSGAAPIVTVQTGSDYLVRVAYPATTDTGKYRLSVTEGPAEDMLATPVAITQPAVGASNTVNGTNTYTGAEPSEPTDDISSMWYRTTKTTAGDIKVDVTGAGFTPVITVWNTTTTSTGALGTPLAKTTGTSLTVDDTTVALNESLRVRISATGSVRGSYAVKVSTIAAIEPVPSCASGITYNGPTWQPTDVSWTIPSSATSAKVYLVNADSTETLLGTTSGNSVTFPTHVRDGRYKGVRVVPSNATGPATGCAMSAITTYVLPCPGSVVTPVSGSLSLATLEWEIVPGADSNDVYQRTYAYNTTPAGPDSAPSNYPTTTTSKSASQSKYEYKVMPRSARYASPGSCAYVRSGGTGGGGGGTI